MGIERLPSGKFETNALILKLAMIAYNVLRIIGTEAMKKQDMPVRHDSINSLGVENALYTLYKVDEHLSILLTRKGSRNRQITLFISQRCIISIAKQICFVNTTYGSKT